MHYKLKYYFTHWFYNKFFLFILKHNVYIIFIIITLRKRTIKDNILLIYTITIECLSNQNDNIWYACVTWLLEYHRKLRKDVIDSYKNTCVLLLRDHLFYVYNYSLLYCFLKKMPEINKIIYYNQYLPVKSRIYFY